MKLASFDIFDTTLIRKCGRPENIFYLLAHRLYDVIGSDTHCEKGVEYLLVSRHSNTRLEVIENILQRTI